MPYTKLSAKDVQAVGQRGWSHLNSAYQLSNDHPILHNMIKGLDDYFVALFKIQYTLIDGMNDLLERVDRIEQMLNAPPGPVRRGGLPF